MAVTPLTFTSEPNLPARLALESYFREKWSKNPEELFVAKPDLNSDNISEFIVYDTSCDYLKKRCSFKIFSETSQGITPLGDITAYRLNLGDNYTKGVRDLLAYESAVNDFESTVYVWEPLEARYKMDGQK